MVENIREFILDQHEGLRQGRTDQVLASLKNLFMEFSTSARWQDAHIINPDFDHLCQQVGRQSAFELLTPEIPPRDHTHDVILVSEVICCGGHAELIGDLARISEVPVILLVTNINKRKAPVVEWLTKNPYLTEIISIEEVSLLEGLRQVQAILAAPNLRNIHILTHGYDSVGIAAIPPSTEGQILYYHHCDHSPALGCHLPQAQHLDLHNSGFLRCRSEANQNNNRYLCLPSLRLPQARSNRRFAYPCLKTASCGGGHKLHTLEYHISYREVIARLLQKRQGVHFHIGLLPEDELNAIHNLLAEYGISSQQFVYMGETPDLPAILSTLEIDLYLPTLPQGGGKAIIDSMSAAVPVLAHQNAHDRLSSSIDLIYPEALSWQSLADFDKIITDFDEKVWHQQSLAALAYYQRFHSREVFLSQLQRGGIQADDAQFPPLKHWLPDMDYRIRYMRGA